MQQLVFFIQKYKYFLYFLLLQIIGFSLTINNYNFHKSKIVSTANSLTGGLYNKTSSISSYFNLSQYNEELISENKKLKNQLENLKFQLNESDFSLKEDTINARSNFQYIPGKIIRNEYNKAYNFLTINRGKSHGIKKELGVINSKGIIGVTEETSNSYARVQSILNSNSKINAKFKNNNHYGSLTWNGKNYNIVQLTDIPRQSVYNIGDTIITGGKSSIFPEGILIGTVLQKTENSSAFNTIDIKLFNDMSNVKNIYIIKNFDIEEIKNLEQ